MNAVVISNPNVFIASKLNLALCCFTLFKFCLLSRLPKSRRYDIYVGWRRRKVFLCNHS